MQTVNRAAIKYLHSNLSVFSSLHRVDSGGREGEGPHQTMNLAVEIESVTV